MLILDLLSELISEHGGTHFQGQRFKLKMNSILVAVTILINVYEHWILSEEIHFKIDFITKYITALPITTRE
jgi:hypothetical protein